MSGNSELRTSDLRSCVTVEVAVLGSPVVRSPYHLCGREAKLNWNVREKSGIYYRTCRLLFGNCASVCLCRVFGFEGRVASNAELHLIILLFKKKKFTFYFFFIFFIFLFFIFMLSLICKDCIMWRSYSYLVRLEV